MKLIKMTGGLGNQMFIYALYLRLKDVYDDINIDLSDMRHYNAHNGYEMHRVFSLPKTEFCINRSLKKVLEFLFFKKVYEKKQKGSMYAYGRRYLWPLVYFKGFYQSESYFECVSDKIFDAFTFNTDIANEKTLDMMKEIESDTDSVSIHIRRGDYLKPEFWENAGSVCQLPYYENAIAEIKKHIENPSFYVFSDDIEWVKNNLKLEKAVYMDWNKKDDSWQDMMLMSKSKHNIICNSTFSWWGAYLNRNKDKIVVMPERWFRNSATPYIYPRGWLKVCID